MCITSSKVLKMSMVKYYSDKEPETAEKMEKDSRLY
jgi:hypothetical protein